MEIYKPLINYDYIYAVSNYGNLKNIKNNKIKTKRINTNGYYYVSLSKNGKSIVKSLHGLIAKTFLDKKIEDKLIDHIDGNKLNNRIENLRYTNYSDNTKNAYLNNKNLSKKLRKVFKFNENYKLVKIYNSLSECRKDNNFKYNSKINNLSKYKNLWNGFYFELENKNNIVEYNPYIYKDEIFIEINNFFDNKFSKYKVSNYGKIFNKRTNKIMKSVKLKDDYERIILVNDTKKPIKVIIHRLVAFKFIENYDKNKVINHLDENKQNNYYKNLEITTIRGNVRYSNAKSIYKYDLEMNLVKKYDCMRDASDELNLKNYGNIVKCCQGKIKTAYKFIWRYVD